MISGPVPSAVLAPKRMVPKSTAVQSVFSPTQRTSQLTPTFSIRMNGIGGSQKASGSAETIVAPVYKVVVGSGGVPLVCVP